MFFRLGFVLISVVSKSVKIDADSVFKDYLDVQQQPEIQGLLEIYEKEIHQKDFIDSKRFESYKLDFISSEDFYFLVERKFWFGKSC